MGYDWKWCENISKRILQDYARVYNLLPLFIENVPNLHQLTFFLSVNDWRWNLFKKILHTVEDCLEDLCGTRGPDHGLNAEQINFVLQRLVLCIEKGVDKKNNWFRLKKQFVLVKNHHEAVVLDPEKSPADLPGQLVFDWG